MELTRFDPWTDFVRDVAHTAVALALLALLPAAAGAQVTGEAPRDLTGPSVSLMAGQMDDPGTLTSNTELDSGPTYGAALSWWVTPWFGLRARGLYADQGIQSSDHLLLGSELDGDREAWLFNGDLLFRKELRLAETTLLPYAALGIGAKRYALNEAESETDAAYNLGAGLEVRLGRAGVFGEADRLISEFDATGWKQFAREWLFTGGVSLDIG